MYTFRKSSYGLGFPFNLPYPPQPYSTHPLDHRITRPGSTGQRRPRFRPPRSQSQEDGRDNRGRFEISERRQNYGHEDIYENYGGRERFNDPQDSTEEDDQSHQYIYTRKNYVKDHDKRKKEERRNDYEMYTKSGNNKKHEEYDDEYRKMYKNRKEDAYLHTESDHDRRTHSNEIQKPNMDSKYWIRDSKRREMGRREERRYKEDWRKDRRSGEDWQTARRSREDSDSQLNFLGTHLPNKKAQIVHLQVKLEKLEFMCSQLFGSVNHI